MFKLIHPNSFSQTRIFENIGIDTGYSTYTIAIVWNKFLDIVIHTFHQYSKTYTFITN